MSVPNWAVLFDPISISRTWPLAPRTDSLRMSVARCIHREVEPHLALFEVAGSARVLVVPAGVRPV